MNTKVLFLLNGWAGKNHLLDNVLIFCASNLIYIILIIAAGCVTYLVYKRQWRQVFGVSRVAILELRGGGVARQKRALRLIGTSFFALAVTYRTILSLILFSSPSKYIISF
ncbi:MAG: hypothetical protein ABI210_10975 [Abditibacteriaceae bacterium]